MHLDSPFFVIKAKCLVFVDVRQLVCLVIVNYLTFLLGIQGSYVANSLVFEGFGQDFLSIVVFINSFEHCRFATLGLSLSQSELSFIFKRGFPFVLVLEAVRRCDHALPERVKRGGVKPAPLLLAGRCSLLSG